MLLDIWPSGITFKMIQPVSRTKAWMTAIGNHEQGIYEIVLSGYG